MPERVSPSISDPSGDAQKWRERQTVFFFPLSGDQKPRARQSPQDESRPQKNGTAFWRHPERRSRSQKPVSFTGAAEAPQAKKKEKYRHRGNERQKRTGYKNPDRSEKARRQAPAVGNISGTPVFQSRSREKSQKNNALKKRDRHPSSFVFVPNDEYVTSLNV